MRQGAATATVLAFALAGSMALGPRVHAQAPAAGGAAGTGQSRPADDKQKPVETQPQAGSQSGANPFPEDVSTVPVLPSKVAPALPEGTYTGTDEGLGEGRVRLPGEDRDPIRSPDDPAPDVDSGQREDSSSSLAGLEKILPPPDDEQTEKKRKLAVKEPTHQERASEDIQVGEYYLDRKNWKAALSRFQSALVLDPENPEVFWGLAEAERHLGEYWDARSHYLTVVDFDPDSKHGKEARKALKDPEIANAKKESTTQAAGEPPK
jgi:hypothetical protein